MADKKGLSALEQLVLEAQKAEAGVRQAARVEAEKRAREDVRVFKEARAQARRALGRLRVDKRGTDNAVGRALAAVDPVTLLGAWTSFVASAPENKDVEASAVARRCRAKWRQYATPETDADDSASPARRLKFLGGGAPVPSDALAVVPVGELDPNAPDMNDALSLELARLFTNADGTPEFGTRPATKPGSLEVRVGDEIRVRGERVWMTVCDVDKLRRLLALEDPTREPKCLGREKDPPGETGDSRARGATRTPTSTSLEFFQLWGALVFRKSTSDGAKCFKLADSRVCGTQSSEDDTFFTAREFFPRGATIGGV